VAKVVVSRRAADDLARLIRTHTLPWNTPDRARRSIQPLGQFPLLGAVLHGQWEGLRFILGPWRWMLVVYRYDEPSDQVVVVTILDGRSSRAPRADGSPSISSLIRPIIRSNSSSESRRRSELKSPTWGMRSIVLPLSMSISIDSSSHRW